jgi:hypothetical protein
MIRIAGRVSAHLDAEVRLHVLVERRQAVRLATEQPHVGANLRTAAA